MKTPTASRERREARRARSANGLNPRGGVNRRGEGRRDHHGRGGPPRPRGEEETSTGAPAATGRRGRKSPQTHLGRRTHQRRVTAAASPFSPRGGPDARGRPPPAPHNVHTQNAAAAAGPGPPSNCSTRTRRAASPGPRRTPEARPRVHGATLPPRGARVPASTAAGVGPDTREPAAAGGEGERHGKDEMPATAGATTGTGPLTRARTEREAAPALAATGRTPGGENGRESHRSHSGSGPATPAAPNRVDPRNDDGPPQRGAPGRRNARGCRTPTPPPPRAPRAGTGPPRRPTTSRTRPTAVSKRPPPRERSIHRRDPDDPGSPGGGKGHPRSPNRGNAAEEGGRAGRRPATRTDHNARTTRGNVQVAGTAKTGTRTGGPHAAGGHGVGAGEQGRVGPGAHHRPSATRPAAPHGDGMGQTARARGCTRGPSTTATANLRHENPTLRDAGMTPSSCPA